MSAITERPLTFEVGGQTLLGILAHPVRPLAAGVLVIVGGPQYRTGSHRQFTSLSRHLARQGFATLRFDVRGMGDSEGGQRGFDDIGDDIGAAIDALMADQPAITRVVLWGLCDGASAALLYVNQSSDSRVAGLVLANPWVRSAASQARAQMRHYYQRRLLAWDFWRRALNPAVAWRAAWGLMQNVRVASSSKSPDDGTSFQERMAHAWLKFGGPILLLQSQDDLTAREFDDALRDHPEWQRAVQAHPPCRVDLAGADHTCSRPEAQRALEQVTSQWLSERLKAMRIHV